MSIAERGNDSCWFLLIVYDYHQPSARPHVPPEETLAMRPAVRFPMVGRLHGFEYTLQVRLKLHMAAVRVQDVKQPGVPEQHYSHTLWRPRLSQDRTLTHGLPVRTGHQCRASYSISDDICPQC